jgi:hypothetical protein
MKGKLLLAISIVTLFAAVSLSAKSFPLAAGPTNPAAAGKVGIGHDKNGNIEVTIKTEHLAKPAMLTPPANTYVVWFKDPSGEAINQGQLKVGDKLKGEYKTTTHLQNIEVFITAENDPNTKVPSDRVVLKGNVQA